MTTKPRAYAGIGSRTTPPEIQDFMTAAAQQLSTHDIILRSGAADGADAAFERGADPRLKEIYLPWGGFNGSNSKLANILPGAFALAEQFHPGWHKLNQAVRKLMARNVHQVFGKNLDDPVVFVLCWTEGGKGHGGTGQALRIANFYEIPIFDFGAASVAEIERGVTQLI